MMTTTATITMTTIALPIRALLPAQALRSRLTMQLPMSSSVPPLLASLALLLLPSLCELIELSLGSTTF